MQNAYSIIRAENKEGVSVVINWGDEQRNREARTGVFVSKKSQMMEPDTKKPDIWESLLDWWRERYVEQSKTLSEYHQTLANLVDASAPIYLEGGNVEAVEAAKELLEEYYDQCKS